MTAKTNSINAHPSPMRMLRALLVQLRMADARLEYDVIDRQVTREEQGIRNACAESRDVNGRIARARAAIHAALVDTKTPNVIDAEEARVIRRELTGAGIVARHHVNTLEAMS